MDLSIFVVDAFTSKQFAGNSAAVIPLEQWLEAEVMQKVALENNLSETAFIKEISNNKYEIRWFSPITEIDFCGHATLAASFVLFNYFGANDEIEFFTKAVGSLTVVQSEDSRIEMSFPNQAPEIVNDYPAALLKGISINPIRVLKNRQAYFAILSSEEDVKNVTYNSEQLKLLAPYDVVVTAKSSDYDFISRYFWPTNGSDEDPVTGSIHAGLVPYWSQELSKSILVAYQASSRGGELYCRLENDRVLVSGYAVLYLRGTIYL
ncbi:PhzF family phenazine biosynthesis protein [Colwelliaceae bacterium 6471]